MFLMLFTSISFFLRIKLLVNNANGFNAHRDFDIFLIPCSSLKGALYIWEYLVKMKRDQSCEWGMKPNLKWSKPFGEPSISPCVTLWCPFTSLQLFIA